jgi:RimJ/RimL family protein N-acetyltransferase
MEIKLERCTLRPFRRGDEEDTARQANNPNVALHLRDRFPQPYGLSDAAEWISHTAAESPPLNFAICLEDRPIGGIGLTPGSDIHRVSAEVGYWLGEPVWGRGIASCALRGLVQYGFQQFDIFNRLFAYVDTYHLASMRVLEKAGFCREGTLIGCAIKEGRIRDQHIYAINRRMAPGSLALY